MGSTFASDRSWWFPVPSARLWDAFCRTGDYTNWWTWLREFDAPALTESAVAHCVIGPPVPYQLHLTVTVVRVVPERWVETLVTGDLEGTAALEIRPEGEGSSARLAWELETRRPVLVGLAVVARPLLEWGHRWVVDTGVSQFRRRALGLG